uniref:Reverse transcriptase domain-containing protein n=1 Tax=Oryzias latipes TaxID=8090 RepID=A0A3P9M519_ORYLA
MNEHSTGIFFFFLLFFFTCPVQQLGRQMRADGLLCWTYFTLTRGVINLQTNQNQINSRSMYANFDNIKEYLCNFSQRFSVIAISETWFNAEKGVENFILEGYELRYCNRLNKGGGGVALYVDKTLHFRVVNSMTAVVDNMLECLTIEISQENQKNIVVSCIYRTPGSNMDMFTGLMEKMFVDKNKVIFVCGDFNIDLLNPHKIKAVEEFINTMYSICLFPRITKPSRITASCATLIDNIFSNDTENKTVNGLLINEISDHLPVFTVYDSSYVNHKLHFSMGYRRIKTETSINAFKTELLEHNWDVIYQKETVDEAYDYFLRIFGSMYDKHCPVKKFKKKIKYFHCPWITKGLQNACKKKNTLYNNYLKKRTKEAEIKYKKYKNKLTQIIRTCKKEYYGKLLEENKSNIKKTWGILNTILRKGNKEDSYPKYFISKSEEIDQREEIAKRFNDFFVNVGPELEKQIPDPGTFRKDVQMLIDRNPSSMFLNPVTENEILKTVRGMKGKLSTDVNGIDMALVKTVISGILKPLEYIFNLSFQTGSFPNQMKIAKVIPLYKTGNKHHFTNYRPVSMLPQLSKILEKMFITRLNSFIEKHKILDEGQYGFRSNRSTSLALMNVIENITNAIDNKKHVIGVFIDLKKAFDTINHCILIHKLDRYGIRGLVLDWIRSYLSNRKQFVKVDGACSQCLDIVCGVPQGSVLGPILFILYINDLFQVSNKLRLVLFADDTNLFCDGDDLQQLIEIVKKEMEKLKLWFDVNKLSLNLSKTKMMLFGHHKGKNINIDMHINGVKLERIYENKFLGV